MWSFEWWPHAIFHGLNPFVPHVIWAPDGANLTQGGFALPAATLALAVYLSIAGGEYGPTAIAASLVAAALGMPLYAVLSRRGSSSASTP